MKEFLKKIGLIDRLSINLNIDKREFGHALKDNVEEGNIGWFSDFWDAFWPGKKEYKGHVGFDSFEIKRKRRFFEINTMNATVKGRYRQDNDELVVDAEINGFTDRMVLFLIVAISFYFFFAGIIIFSGEPPGEVLPILFPALFIHFLFMLGIPYFMARRSVKRLKYDLERELYFLTRNRARA